MSEIIPECCPLCSEVLPVGSIADEYHEGDGGYEIVYCATCKCGANLVWTDTLEVTERMIQVSVDNGTGYELLDPSELHSRT